MASGWEMQEEIERKIAWWQDVSRSRRKQREQQEAEAQRKRDLEMMEVYEWL